MNKVLKSLFELDQQDHSIVRTAGTSEYNEMRIRDANRREQVRTILKDENIDDPIDLYHAAWIFNHGDQPADAEQAYCLAERSLHAGYEDAKWLFAAAFDRWCMYRGQPQKFGTQMVPDGKRYRIWDTDPKTTDEERKQYNVPPFRELLKRAEKCSIELAQPPMDLAPPWLIAAMARWTQDEREE